MEAVADAVFTYSEVVQLRETIIGSELAMTRPQHCLMWMDRGDVRATFIDSLPVQLEFDREGYALVNTYLGDWDVLLDVDRQIVGFSLSTHGSRPLRESAFAMQRNVRLENTRLHVILRVHERYQVKRLGGMGARLYMSPTGKFMVCLPQWIGWGGIYFPVTHDKMPQPLS